MVCTPGNSGLPHEPARLPTEGLQWWGGRREESGLSSQQSLMGCDSSSRAYSCRLPSQGGRG